MKKSESRKLKKTGAGIVEGFTIKIKGEHFRCTCGCNVFTKYEDTVEGWETYICNVCKKEIQLK